MRKLSIVLLSMMTLLTTKARAYYKIPMSRYFLLLAFTLLCSCLFSQIKDTTGINTKRYEWIIQDSPVGLNTMRQSDQNYLSTYRYVSDELGKVMSTKANLLVQFVFSLFTYPVTHEEGHRSILTSLGIGAISQPLYNLKGVAYVNGVTDEQLQRLRDTDLPDYIRVHTAGIESDYMLSLQEERMITLGEESRKNLFVEVYFRKLCTMLYFTGSLIPSMEPKLKEDANELKNDIVGHDVYGAIKNLYRPQLEFHRYTLYEDLTTEEKHFVNRVGYRALVNLISPVFIKKLNFANKSDFKLGIGAGYAMSPFGDFIDENFYIQLKKKYTIHAYLREYQNRNTWFPAAGVTLYNCRLTQHLSTTIAAHGWSQPAGLDFNTTKSQLGAAGDVLLKYIVLHTKKKNSVSLDLGVNCKTAGFLPEEVILKKHFGVRLGASLNISQK